jgi:hypothetical protein
MGLDEETSDGHRIYWPERRTITVERSVKFNFDNEVVVGVLPLEGEHEQVVEPTIVEQQTQQPEIPEIVSTQPEIPLIASIQPEEELG